MGSRVMHSIIAFKVAQELGLSNKAEFLLGGIAADATKDKETSHFYEGYHEDYTRKIDYEKFIQKYEDRATYDFILGYYSHLIADEYWLSGFYLPWLKNRMEADANILAQYHQDFQLLNHLLVEFYGLKKELTALFNQPMELIQIDEIEIENLWNLVANVLQDINIDSEQAQIQADLKVFTFAQIIGYIETSVEKSKYMIERIKIHAL